MEVKPYGDLSEEEMQQFKHYFGDVEGKKIPFDRDFMCKALQDPRVEKVEVTKLKVGDRIRIKDIEGEILAISLNNELKIKTLGGLIIRTKMEH